MSSTVIKVEGVGKSFVINHEQKERYTALRDVVSQKAKKIFSFPFALQSRPVVSKETFWALSDINFTVEQGDRLGIIGRNGAGKSTLLKILSRITEPATGTVSIKGRVASLLEVGTGFHPELTGRENIFLNGAILGMSRQEIKMKFDEIVDFAEVEQFLDTPVKRYSSGMYVRLAFAVAAHLEPEILIIDEVLAVGDVQFQKKCLGKMEDVSKNGGRTVLFVSHNMSVMKSLCNKGILLSQGKIVDNTDINTLVAKYLTGDFLSGNKQYYHREGGKQLRITDMVIAGKKSPLIKLDQPIEIRIEYESTGYTGEAEFFILLYNTEGECLQGVFQEDENTKTTVKIGKAAVTVKLANVLIPGRYFVSAGCFDKGRHFLDWVEHGEQFEVDVLYPDERLFRPRLGLIKSSDVKWREEM